MASTAVSKESTAQPISHGHVVVGTTAVQISTTSPAALFEKGLLLRAPLTNTVDVYIGTALVTADTTATTGGFPLAPGDAVFVPIDDHSKIWVRASVITQDVAWFAV